MQVLLVLALLVACRAAARNLSFPQGFMFGAGTAAYQVEGAWNTSGKGESIWDRLTHARLSSDPSAETADVAADSYHRYREDVLAAKNLGLDFYRFSISWPRILPKGDLSFVNPDGINYYNNLINELKRNNIEPLVTMYHWDLPQHLQDLGGLASDIIIDYFEDYARLLFTHFGDRWWTTFNEPLSFVTGYSSAWFAPGVDAPGVGGYLVAHNILKAHARVYHLYRQHFRGEQKGKVSITLNLNYPQPKTSSPADHDATERYLQFNLGWFAHPIYSSEGDYPAIMKERIANNSRAEGLPRSRLPEFGEHWVKYIRGTHDFYGMNIYSSYYVSAPNTSETSSGISFANDMGPVLLEQDPSWPAGSISNFRYAPFGLRKMLKWVSDNYHGVPVLVTENGWVDRGEMNDSMRIRYLVNHYAALLDAVHLDHVTVLGHSVWSLIDTFEWGSYDTACTAWTTRTRAERGRPGLQQRCWRPSPGPGACLSSTWTRSSVQSPARVGAESTETSCPLGQSLETGKIRCSDGLQDRLHIPLYTRANNASSLAADL
ncbi:myrosinase 1-like isoform X2 [Bacillus rossius redtenbacheri]|uniref:myrosinase 1-like isoform X2 n=1 Tax=Bacillus rossius redtenbacheri TaxID=93214 RepID=UPI002FDD47AA